MTVGPSRNHFARRQLSYIFRQMNDAHILRQLMTADYVRLLLREGRTRGLSAADLLSGTELTEKQLSTPDIRTTQRDNIVVAENFCRHLGRGCFLRMRLGPETTGPLGQAVTTAPTIRKAFWVLSHFGQSRSPRYAIRLAKRKRGTSALEIVETMISLPENRLTGDEGIMLSLHNMIETLVGSDIGDACFKFRSPAPAHANLYAKVFRAPVCFDAPMTAIEFPLNWLDRPGPFSNPPMFAAATTTLEIERTALREGGIIIAEVEQMILARGNGDLPGLNDIAVSLGTSIRTLERRLRAAGTNFRAIRESVLSQRARHLLSKTDRSIESISAELGYSDPVAFNLACHRWFGASPGDWRRRRCGGA